MFSELFPKRGNEVQNRRIYSFDDFQLDVSNRQLRRGDKALSLPAKAFDLLVTLVENKGRLVEKDELFKTVWQDQIVEESNLTVHISQIRKALGETKTNPRFIETVPGYGYRFTGDVSNFEDEEFVIETETLSRITIEKEEINDAEQHDTKIVGREADWLAPGKSEAARKHRFKYAVAAASLICLTTASGIYYLNGRKSAEPFEKVKLTRLTNSGQVSAVTVSPDGKYIAYVLGESEGNSLWVQQVGTASNVRLLPPVKAQVYELTFTPDGSHIFYNLFADGNADPEFYRVSSLGGVTEKLPNVIASFITFAPDGKRFAYAQSDSVAGQNYLVIADADGRNQQTIVGKKHPNTFETQVPVVAWSPDGETIACLVNHFEAQASYSSIVGINARDGSEEPLSDQRWYEVFSIEWLKNGSGLLISASDKVSGSNQVRFLSYPQGEARQITNDLSQYDSLSATANGESFVSIQTNTINGIYIGEAGADANQFEEIASETGALHPFVWTPNGKIIFSSNKDGISNLWTMDADGSNRRQLTTDAQVDSRGLCISADGKYLVFGSWRNGKSNLWRVDADGRNLTQLTNGEVDVYPSCSPDNRTVVYQKGLHSRQMLWRVPLAGGEPVQLTDSYSKWSAISNDGSRISYLFMADKKWRFGIISSEGGSLLKRLDVPATLNGSSTHWSPDDQSLLYISTVGNVGNVWSLPLNGSTVRPYTNFTSQLLSDFSLSPDGKHFAVSRMSSTSDAVLISNAR
jgi:DNA-binding winged helix-turn-helix (wHTH) protein/Tol biopolymer transport system component